MIHRSGGGGGGGPEPHAKLGYGTLYILHYTYHASAKMRKPACKCKTGACVRACVRACPRVQVQGIDVNLSLPSVPCQNSRPGATQRCLRRRRRRHLHHHLNRKYFVPPVERISHPGGLLLFYFYTFMDDAPRLAPRPIRPDTAEAPFTAFSCLVSKSATTCCPTLLQIPYLP